MLLIASGSHQICRWPQTEQKAAGAQFTPSEPSSTPGRMDTNFANNIRVSASMVADSSSYGIGHFMMTLSVAAHMASLTS
jgi:hypothetical protein